MPNCSRGTLIVVTAGRARNFNVNNPLLNVNSFEPPTSFNFYAGSGPRIATFRQFGYNNIDLGLSKRFAVGKQTFCENSDRSVIEAK